MQSMYGQCMESKGEKMGKNGKTWETHPGGKDFFQRNRHRTSKFARQVCVLPSVGIKVVQGSNLTREKR